MCLSDQVQAARRTAAASCVITEVDQEAVMAEHAAQNRNSVTAGWAAAQQVVEGKTTTCACGKQTSTLCVQGDAVYSHRCKHH